MDKQENYEGHWYGLDCGPLPYSNVEALTPCASQNGTIFGDRAFKLVIKLKFGHAGRP